MAGSVVDTSEADWDRVLNLSLKTTFLAAKSAVPVMAAKGAGDEARWITGVVLPVDGGVTAATPLMMAPHLRAERSPA